MRAARPSRATPRPQQADPASLRLFTALWPGPAARRSLQRLQQDWAWTDRARPTPPARLHLTLHFLGQVPAAQADALRAALADWARRVPGPAFELRLDRAEVWPNGVAVLLPSQVPVALTELHADMGRALVHAGFAPESRPYRPHVSLARKAAGSTAPSPLTPLRMRVQSVVLARSLHGYRVLARWPLAR